MSTKPNTNQITYDTGSNKQDLNNILDTIIPITDYTALRNYTGRATQVRITDDGIAGLFKYDSTDTTSIDNGGTIILAGSKRWKRVFDGAVNVKWFGASPNNTPEQNTLYIQSAINASPEHGTVILTGGTHLIDIPSTNRLISDLGSNEIFYGLIVNSKITFKCDKYSSLKIKDFSTAYAAQDNGDMLCAVAVNSSFATVDGLRINCNTTNHYELSNGFKFWEEGPTKKRPPNGIIITCAPTSPNVEYVDVKNCDIYDSLAGIYFYGNAVDTARAAFLNGTLATGVVKNCHSQCNTIRNSRGNGVLFNLGVDGCTSTDDVFIDCMYHAARIYSRAINCSIVNGRSDFNADRVLSRYNATDNGYWRTNNPSHGEFKIIRSGFHVGGADSYSATYGYSVTNSEIINCKVKHARSTTLTYSDYFIPSSLYIGAFTTAALPNTKIKNCTANGSDYGIVLYADGIAPGASYGIDISENKIYNSGVNDYYLNGVSGASVSGNTITANSTFAYYSAFLINMAGSTFSNNEFNGTPASTSYAIYIAGTTTGLQITSNRFGINWISVRECTQDAASTPILLYPRRTVPLIATNTISSTTLSNGWTEAVSVALEGHENGIRANNDGSITLCIRVSGAAATANTIATLVSNLRPVTSIGFVATDVTNNVSCFGRVLSTGAIQIQLPAFPSASFTQCYAEVTYMPKKS